MRHANQDIRSIVTLLGYHKAQQRLSRNGVESNSISSFRGVQGGEIRPVAATESMKDVRFLQNHPSSPESQHHAFEAEHYDDVKPELFF
jgi:hypothetical protein